MVKKVSERWEAWMRIIVGIITGIILGLWKVVVQILGFIHWIIVVITGKRNKAIADFSELWNTQMYIYLRYMTFVQNERPFPFGELSKEMSKFK
jgi:hypothetical protein